MRRFVKVLSALFAVIMLFTGLPQASAAEEQTADPKIPLSSSGELPDIGMSEDETMTEPSEHIYDLSLSKSRIYLLPGMSFRLTVSAVTEPFDPQPELSTESTAPTEETTAAPAIETTAPVTDEAVTEETTLPAETELNDDPVMPQLSEIEITESEATEATVEEATVDAPTEETTAEETTIEGTTTEPTTAEETTADIVTEPGITEPETTESEKPIGAITPIPIGEDDNESYIWRSNDEVEHDENNSKLTSQGIHYDPSTDKLYRPLSSSNNVKENDVYVYKLNYNSVTDTSNPTSKEHWNIDRVSGNNSFEIEGIGFMPNETQVWFNVFEGDLLNSEICVDHKKK